MRWIGAVPWMLLTALGVGDPQAEQRSGESPLEVYPLPAGLVFERVSIGADGSATATAGVDEKLVYSNTLGNFVVPLPANARFSDDLTLSAAPGCSLRRLEFPVVGKVNPAGVGGPFTITTALYTNCPNSVPLARLPDILVGGSNQVLPFPDDTNRLVFVDYGEGLALPANVTSLWLAVTFNRGNVGIVAGAPALEGFSCDLYDFPGAPCNNNFGGFPDHGYGAIKVELFGNTDGCAVAHVGYRANRPAQSFINLGANVTITDDIRLGVQSCRMIGYEVAVKGFGAYSFELRNNCDTVAIAGTQAFLSTPTGTTSSTSVILRKSFEPPIQIPNNFSFAATVNNFTSGVVLSGQQACVGETQDFLEVPPEGGGCTQIQSPVAGQRAALNVTIFCQGPAPTGACCDMFFTNDNDDSVCRNVPRMNCAFSSAFNWEPSPQPDWVEGGGCDSDPFPHPCGAAACCRPDYGCENLTKNECNAIEPLDRPRQWQRGAYCGFDEQRCPFIDCLAQVGDCTAPHEGGGCYHPQCCTTVCGADDFCCRVEWDRVCVELAAQLCESLSDHDDCFDSDPRRSALEISANGQTIFSNTRASYSDPAFDCLPGASSTQGLRTVWFKFVATHDSVTIDATQSLATDDSMIQVFAIGDPTTEGTACATLQPIGCSDDVRGCLNSSLHPRFCVTGLVPGSTYYIMFGAKYSYYDDHAHLLDLLSPCTAGTGDCDSDGILDQCEPDCNSNDHPDYCDVLDGRSLDCNENAVPDECDPDCNENRIPDDCDIASGTSEDCDADTLPDDCFSETLRLAPLLEYPTYSWSAAITEDFLAVGGYGLEVFRRDGVHWRTDEILAEPWFYPNFVAASGDWLLAGYTIGYDWTVYGVAEFYHWNGTRWDAPFKHLGPEDGESLGGSYALAGDIHGDHAAVSGLYDSDHNSPRAIHLLYRQGNSWVIYWSIVDPEPNEGGYFGSAVALDANTLAVGRTYPSWESHLPVLGKVYIYDRVSSYAWQRSATITSPEGATTNRFGARLDLESDTLVVADHPSEGGEYQVRVFRRNEDDWTLETRLAAQPPYEHVALGTSISIRDGRIAMTPVEPGQNDPIVYTFERTASGWQNTLRWSDPERPPDPSATFVTAAGSENVVVAQGWSESARPIIDLFPVQRLDCNANQIPDACEPGACAGAAWRPDGTPGQCRDDGQVLTPSTPSNSFGNSLAVEGDVLVIGNDQAAADASVYVYRHDGRQWRFEDFLRSPDLNFGLTGWSAAIAGGRIYATATSPPDSDNLTLGAVLGFEREGDKWVHRTTIRIDDPTITYPRMVSAVHANAETIAVSTGDAMMGGVFVPSPALIYVHRLHNDLAILEARLTADEVSAGATFGGAIDVYGDRIVVGANERQQDSPVPGGSVLIYRRSNGTWSLEAQVDRDYSSEQLDFGGAVSLSGDLLAVKGLGRASANTEWLTQAYIYRNNRGVWEQEGTVAGPQLGATLWGESLTFVNDGLIALSGEAVADGSTFANFGERLADGTWCPAGFVRTRTGQFLGNPVTAVAGTSDSVMVSGDGVVTVFPITGIDCNANGQEDRCDIESGQTPDCNNNRVPDACDWRGAYDSDFDGDADLRDVASMLTCFTGTSGGSPGVCCRVFDAGADQDVDAADWAALHAALGGPGRP